MTRIVAAALAHASLFGCATPISQIQVQYLSDPPGATLYSQGNVLGVTPATMFYSPDLTFKNGGCIVASGTNVVWASGAKAQLDSLRLCAITGWQ